MNIPNFEYFYFLVMIIFCAKMTPETTKMENFGGAIIPFSIPISEPCSKYIFLNSALDFGLSLGG